MDDSGLLCPITYVSIYLDMRVIQRLLCWLVKIWNTITLQSSYFDVLTLKQILFGRFFEAP